MAFLHGWSPGRGRGRWRSWAEFLADFRSVRVELVAHFPPRRADHPLFGDAAMAYQQQHGAEALAQATYGQIRAGAPTVRP